MTVMGPIQPTVEGKGAIPNSPNTAKPGVLKDGTFSDLMQANARVSLKGNGGSIKQALDTVVNEATVSGEAIVSEGALQSEGGIFDAITRFVPGKMRVTSELDEALCAVEDVDADEDGIISASGIFAILPYIQKPDELELPADLNEKLNMCLELTDTVIAVLEGKLPDMDIEPLLNQLDQVLASLDVPLEQIDQPAAKEVMARMPQLTGMLEQSELKEVVKTDYTALYGNLCPLENDNESADVQAATAQNTGGQSDANDALKNQTPKAEAGTSRTFLENQVIDISPERVIFSNLSQGETAQMTQEAAPVSSDELFMEMIERITSIRDELNGQQLEISLKPDHLGKVSLKLALTDEGLTAKISADNAGVRDAIHAQVSELIDSLNEKGVKITQIDVVYTGMSDHNGFDKNGANQNEPQKKDSGIKVEGASFSASSGELEGELADAGDLAQPEAVTDPELSSVEYRA